jgi:glycosyltransferase involved in cell wall biosynthesis
MDRYASRLARSLRRYATDLEIHLAGEISGLTLEPTDQAAAPRTSGAWRLPQWPAPGASEMRRYLARYWTYPRRVHRMSADLVHVLDHSYAHLLLTERRRPTIVTVHDLLPVMTVKRGARTWRDYLRNWLLERVLKGLRRADAWVVATEWMRAELSQWLGGEEAIHVVPFGVDDAFLEQPPRSRPEARARWNLPEGAFVLLHVGSVVPRKNLPVVISTLDGLRRLGIDAWLLQIGGQLTEDHLADVQRRGLTGYVRSVGEATEPELRAAYHASDVLLFPSLYEGFGFPVLEAMASGLPVVTSGAGGLAEVAGSAAVVVGGREAEPYVTAVRRVAENRHWRDQLVARGRSHARQFRWVETARKTAEVYRQLV